MEKKAIVRKATPSKTTERLNKLQQILSSDKQLTADNHKFQLYLTLAKMYEGDLANNIMLSSFDLDKKYSTHDPHTWTEFKEFTPVRNYIRSFTDEMHYTEAVRTINQQGNRTADALKIAEKIEASRESEKNTDVIVFLIPQRNYQKTEQ